MGFQNQVFVFGDTTGALVGAGVFLLISAGIGAGFFMATRRLPAMGSLDPGQPPSKISVLLGLGVGVCLFLILFESSIAGFRSLEVQGERLTLRYDLPPQMVIYPAIHMSKVDRVPAFKGQWRLMVEDIDGARYYSALADRRVVEKAWTALHPLIDATPSVQHPAS